MYHLSSTNSSALLARTPFCLSVMQSFLQSCPEFILGSTQPRSRYFCGCLGVKMKTAIIPLHNFGLDSKQVQKQAHKQDSRGAHQCLVFVQGWKCSLCCSVICWEHCIQGFVYSFSEASKTRKKTTLTTHTHWEMRQRCTYWMSTCYWYIRPNIMISINQTDMWKECVIMLLHPIYHLHVVFGNEYGGGLRQLHCT